MNEPRSKVGAIEAALFAAGGALFIVGVIVTGSAPMPGLVTSIIGAVLLAVALVIVATRWDARDASVDRQSTTGGDE